MESRTGSVTGRNGRAHLRSLRLAVDAVTDETNQMSYVPDLEAYKTLGRFAGLVQHRAAEILQLLDSGEMDVHDLEAMDRRSRAENHRIDQAAVACLLFIRENTRG